MASRTDVEVIITAKDSASKVLNNVGRNFGKLGGVAAGVAKVGIAASIAALGALTVEGFRAVKAFNEQESALAQLDAVLKSTKGAAGLARGEIIKLSESLQKSTTFADEEILAAENLLLTFTKVGTKTFPDATKVILDMSVALGQDLKSSTIQVGKALQDPILGITALRRVGVNFNEQQKEQIQRLVESGKHLEAQKFILRELQTEFGGSAEAARNTFGGALKSLSNTLNDLEETFGGALAKGLEPFLIGLSNFAQSDQATKIAEGLASALLFFGQAIKTAGDIAIPIFLTLKGWIDAVRAAFSVLWVIIAPIFQHMAESLKIVYQALRFAFGDATLKDIVNGLKVFAAIIGVVLIAGLSALSIILRAVAIAFTVLAFGAKPVIQIFKTIFEWAAKLIDKLGELIGKVKGFGIGNFKLGSFKLPGFQTGGIVPGPIGQPRMVMAHGGEEIKSAGVTGASGPTFNVSVNVGTMIASDIARRNFAEQLIKDMENIATMKGQKIRLV